MNWQRARALFPAVEKSVYLNTAGGAPLSVHSAAAARRYYDQALADGDVHWDAWLEEVEVTRRKLARLLHTRPASLAFLANASTGLNVAAHMLRGHGRVLAVADEFPSCSLPWLQLGYEVDFLPTAADGSIDAETIAAAMRDETGVLATSFVQYKTGYRCDLAALGALCDERDVAFVVDATQGFAAFPIEAAEAHIDFLSFSGYKWATAGYSIAGLYLRERFLKPEQFPLVGWRSSREPYELVADRLDVAPRAAALESGHPPFAGIFALGAALTLIDDMGIDNIAERILELTGYLHKRLDGAGIGVLSTRDPDHRSGITIADVAEPEEAVAALRERDIVVSTRGRGIRISVHYYNNREDVDALVAVLQEIGP